MSKRTKYKDLRFSLLYLLPSIIMIFGFSVLPILMDIYYSFTSYNMIMSPVWVGLENFQRLFTDPYIGASIRNTVVFTFVTVPLQTIISLVIAALLAERFQNTFGEFTRSALFIPTIASMVLIGSLWFIILAPTGPVNSIIKAMGGEAVNWLGSKHLSLFSICFISIWKNIGYFLVIFYAGILDIPQERYEAAEIDGANVVQRFFNITVPGLSSVLYLVVTLGTIWSFQVFDLVYMMTGGGPGLSTQTLVLTIYNTAFKSYNMGYASAIALLMFVFVLLLSILQKKLMGTNREE